jgi:hypothetical protein
VVVDLPEVAMIEAAVQAHFMRLFDVLMASDLSPEAYERFERGLERLRAVEENVRGILAHADKDA